ncbi:DUF3226 domain-containing protein [Inhella sp.]|uniref:DUF3226 domain-containing protein n=1 Tax=Inhella sp. TaxID=1921806 RepID=UPI0035AE54E9
MKNDNSVKHSKILLVEGKDEKNLCECALDILKIADVQIIDCEGGSNIAKRLLLLSKDENFSLVTNVVIVCDAEKNILSRIHSLQSALASAGLPNIRSDTLASESFNPKVSAWISPDCQSNGMLEDLFIKTLESTELMKLTKAFVDSLRCLPKDISPGAPTFPTNIPKAIAHACLTATDPLVKGIGLAVKRGFWDLNHAAMDQFRSFLLTSFADATPSNVATT